MSDTVLSGEYHADVTELASQIRELQAQNERLKSELEIKHAQLKGTQLAEAALKLKLEQYESTPERGLGSIIRGHFDLGGVTRTIQLFDREGRLVNNISITAEDIG